jgi:hypothetical protein
MEGEKDREGGRESPEPLTLQQNIKYDPQPA